MLFTRQRFFQLGVNDYRRHTAGGNPAMDWHHAGGSSRYSQSLHTIETGLKSGCEGLPGSCVTLTYLIHVKCAIKI